tara:strand:+ start:306 stop:1805 length:1500 start_codon:yes stop_codon:yes gene_type:complete
MVDKKKVLIIGGGTAGLTIANNLQDYFDVTVIEKSKYKKYPHKYRPPLMIGLLFRSPQLKYMSKRNFILPNGRHIPFFESNVLGGASVINGAVHTIGSNDSWSNILKKFNSNYEDLIKSFNKIYSKNPKEKNKITLSLSYQNIIDRAFIKTLNIFGIPKGDSNYSDYQSCGPIYNTVRKFFRTSVLSTITKKNFNYHVNECVEEILFKKTKAVGVKTNLRIIDADFVILSGGVIGTCKLLFDQRKVLNQKGNKIFNNLPIGKNIQDHTNLRVNVLTNKEIGSLNEISNSSYQKLSLLLKHYLGKHTLMKGTGASSFVNLDLDGDGKIDTRIQVVQFSETGRHGSDGSFFSSSHPGFSLSITTINPSSKGEVISEGSNNVNPMYLSSRKDIDLLKLALKFCLKLLRSSPLNEHILKIEEEVKIENNPEEYIHNNIYSGHHLIGGMQDAISSNFEIKGTQSLYVCDASIFNHYAASNIHSSVILIADIFFNKFIKNHKGDL